MKNSPIKVKLIEKKGNSYLIQFPNLKIPVTVNDNLYQKMLHSTMYEFGHDNIHFSTQSNSA